jgi:hypothetical protein
MRAVLMVTTVLMLSCGAARTQTDDETKWAIGEVGEELEQCSVYFMIASSCIAKQEPSLSLKYKDLSQKAVDLAIAASRASGKSDEAYLALQRILTEEMMKSMDGSCVNIAVLLKKYTNFCPQLVNDTDRRIDQWIACIRAKKKTCGGP